MEDAYVSWLEWMRIRAFAEGNDQRNFWHMWNITIKMALDDHKMETTDYTMYKAEEAFWDLYWPVEIFPGQNPNRKYKSQLRMMQHRACIQEYMTHQRFTEIHGSYEDVRKKANNESDYGYYVVEKQTWDFIWGHLPEEFPGIDPSLPPPSPTTADSAAATTDTDPAVDPERLSNISSEIVSHGPEQSDSLQNPQSPPAGTVQDIVSGNLTQYDIDENAPTAPAGNDLDNVSWDFRQYEFSEDALSAPAGNGQAKRPLDENYFDDLVDTYEGEGIDFGVGGKGTPRKLDFTPNKKRVLGDGTGAGA